MDLDQCYDKFQGSNIMSDYTDDESKFSHNWRKWVKENHPDRKMNVKDAKTKDRITQKFQEMSDCKDKIYNDLYKNKDKSITNTFENLMDEIDQSKISKDEKIANGIELLHMLYNYSNSLLEHAFEQDDYIMIQMVNAIILGLILVTKRFFKLPGNSGSGSGQVGGENETENETGNETGNELLLSRALSSMTFSNPMSFSNSSPTMIPAGVLESQMKQLEVMEKMIEVQQKQRLYDIDIRKAEKRLAAQDIVNDMLIIERDNLKTEHNKNRFDIGVHYITMILGFLMGPFFSYQGYTLLDLTIVDVARILNEGAINMNLKLGNIYDNKSNFITRYILDKTIGFSEIATMSSSQFLKIAKNVQIIISGLLFFAFLAIYMIYISFSGSKGRESIRQVFALYSKTNKIEDKPQRGEDKPQRGGKSKQKGVRSGKKNSPKRINSGPKGPKYKKSGPKHKKSGPKYKKSGPKRRKSGRKLKSGRKGDKR